MPRNIEVIYTNYACTASCEFISVVFDSMNYILPV